MEIRDVVHGSIAIEPHELPILDSRQFQRLRLIKQLGFAENSFPAATHNRYIHSVGALEAATQAFDTLFGGPRSRVSQKNFKKLMLSQFRPKTHARFRAAVRLAALLHDVGHGPLSHTTEFAMPEIDDPKSKSGKRQATHEDYTLRMILNSSLTDVIEKSCREKGLKPIHIAALIDGSISTQDSFFVEKIDGQNVDFRPILSQLISSELDADRMDYLRRDSFYAGVSYGQFDFDWIIGNLVPHIREGKCFLALHHRALYSFEDFLLSRYHMFLMVYFHYKSVVYDELLGQYFRSKDCDYALPWDIDAYCECNDMHLYTHLAKSSNEWAKRIIEKRPYKVLVELHSGIPSTKTAKVEQDRLLKKIEDRLKSKKVHYLMATSTGEVSKYYRKAGHPIFVRYDNRYTAPQFIPLEQCTDLFQKYSEKRKMTRIYVSPEVYPVVRNIGRGEALRYEDEV